MGQASASYCTDVGMYVLHSPWSQACSEYVRRKAMQNLHQVAEFMPQMSV